MPWLAVPWDFDRGNYATKNGIDGIPALVIMNKKDGTIK